MWNVKFHIVPITLQSLVSGSTEEKSEVGFKGNLSFDEAKSVLVIGELQKKCMTKNCESIKNDKAKSSLICVFIPKLTKSFI